MLNKKMKSKVINFLFITLLVALAVNSANAKTRAYLSKDCSNYLKVFYQINKPSIDDFKILEDQDYYLHTLLKRKGAQNVKVKAVAFQDRDNQKTFGFQFNWKNQSIVHCWSFYHTALITLIEKYDHYDPLVEKQNEAVKISTHYFVNCGVPCHHAEVTSAYLVDNGTRPYVRKEISTPTFEYPSMWFKDYLTLEELFQFMSSESGFESFDWRGKSYKTEELRKSLSDYIKYQAYLNICLKENESLPKNCEELYDTKGPYKTRKECKRRISEMISDLPKYKSKFKAKGYICEKGLREDSEFTKLD